MKLRDVFLIKEVDLRLIPGGKPAGEEYGPQDPIAGLRDVDQPEEAEDIAGRYHRDLGLEVETAIYALKKIQSKLAGETSAPLVLRAAEEVQDVLSNLGTQARIVLDNLEETD